MTDAHDNPQRYVLNLAEAHVVSRLNELVTRFGIHPAESQITLRIGSANDALPVFIGFHHTDDDANAKKLDSLSKFLAEAMREKGLSTPDENEMDELGFRSYRDVSDVIDMALKRAPKKAPLSRA
ncbi:MAG: hypothetical protein K2Q12_08965 [Rickettsiales bacterium]|nr:hypothetical protein [Rickettsiales bacterium]